ncbi:MAG: hypothetical protein ACI4VL_05280 [Bacilli bacterium]
MKKISDKSFWIILIISVISLIILTVGVIFLTKKSEKEFYSAGYIISSNKTKTDKYYFNDNTVYKENVFDEYVFKNVDNKEVKTSKDNFIHYLDNSLSFMKNGVILDLDNFNEKLVPYYNITDKSIIKYNNGSYYVETADKTLIFGNFLGRISENKYIVVGKNIKIKLAGNEELVSGDYFEILFVEDGIVKIENQEGSYQTVSDGTIIYVGDNIKINLGDQNVYYGDENKLSLSEMTIDGDENIDINPATGKVDKDTGNKGEDSTTGNEQNTEPGNNQENGNGSAFGGEITSVIKKGVSVEIITAKTGVNDLSASFRVIDTANRIKNNLILTLTDINTGKQVYNKQLANVSDIQNVNISSLSPDSNYLMTISEENKNSSITHFQKIFKTESMDGLKLIRELVTTDSLSYSLDFGTNNDIKSADISLYDYDEEGELKPITRKVVNGENNTVVFEKLNSNTTYDVKVDGIVVKNTNYESQEKIETSDTTLKKKPTLGEITVNVDENGQEFLISMTEPVDPDKSIIKYTYEIYKAEDIKKDTISTAKPIYRFSRRTLKTEKLKIDENNIISKKDYYFKVIVEYYDNYKFGEISTTYSGDFIEFKQELVDFNKIKGTVKINDENCTVPNSGRTCFDQPNNFIIRYSVGATHTDEKTINDVTFDSETMEYQLSLSGLTENTLYTFDVYADVDLKNGKGLQEGYRLGSFTVTTKGIEALRMQNWKQNEYSFEEPISVNTEMVSTVPESDYGNKLSSITFNLYRDDVKEALEQDNSIIPIGTFTEKDNIKEKYYNKEFTLSSDMFGIENLDHLRELSGGELSRYYTIEVTDAYDESGINKFDIIDNTFVFETPALLRIEDEVSAPEILVEEITNIQTKSGEFKDNYGITYDGKLNDNIIRGYKVTAIFDKSKIETYFQGSNPVTSLNFYVYNKYNTLVEEKKIDMTAENKFTEYFFLDYGTDYNTNDNDLRRGNAYTFSYDISIDTNNDGNSDAIFPSNKPVSDKMISTKQDPSFRMYIDNSTDNSITYKYIITDYDNALYKDTELDKYYLYYKVNDSEIDYTTEIEKSTDMKLFTLSNLTSSSIYNLSYYRASNKEASPSKINIGSFFFDGNYKAEDYNLGYKLEYGNFDNRLKILIDDNDFLNRISTYLLTLDAGTDKYQTVVSDLSDCDGNKCIIIDYSDISSFKGKDITVSLEAFYDTGYVGFSQKSKLGNYFQNMSLVDAKNSSKLGFVYQTNGGTGPGGYVYITNTGAYASSATPKGILGFELTNGTSWKLTTTNIVDLNQNKFVPYGTVVGKNTSVSLYPFGIYATNDKYYLNPKVLDKVNIQTDDNSFKFTSITPKVKTTHKPLINGATVNIDLSIDTTTLESDFVKTDGKYKFYIDIYKKQECIDGEECTENLIPVETFETDYDHLSEVTFQGLDPATKYYYKIFADMNKNNSKVKTPLFDYNRTGYVEYINEFTTLGKDDLLSRTVNYSYESTSTDTVYSNRKLKLQTYLKTNVNFDIKYELYDTHAEGTENLIFEGTVPNSDITTVATYIKDITDDNLVFGNDYYTLKVYAVTTDLGKKLELFNDKLSDKGVTGQNYHELKNPTFTVEQEAVINTVGENNDYGINYKINITDSDKVIKDGIVHIELQEPAPTEEGYVNACGEGHEEECRATINLMTDGVNITKSFTGLKPDTHYVIYIYADTYRNNVSLSEEEKNGLVYVRKSQYTKSDLGFSLGLVTPTAVSKTKLVITFSGAANLQSSLKGIEYGISVQGGSQIASGKIGKTTASDTDNIIFGIDPSTGYPTININMPSGKQLSSNNYIQITYYYEDKDGNLVALKIGDKTVHSYGVIYEG